MHTDRPAYGGGHGQTNLAYLGGTYGQDGIYRWTYTDRLANGGGHGGSGRHMPVDTD